MTDTQTLVLFVTFLVASLLVVPLIYLGFKKDKERKAQKNVAQRKSAERILNQEKLASAEEKRDLLNRKKAATVRAFEEKKPEFKRIRDSLYRSRPCKKCDSHIVFLENLGSEVGVMQVHCVKCSTQKRVFPTSKEAFANVAPELLEIVTLYRTVSTLVPEYTGLGFSFLESDPRE